jgi:hypothetical protein
MKNNIEIRKQRRLEKLGTNDPRCVICGERDWRCLELHHIADHGKDAQTVVVCRNCHRKASDAQSDHPAHLPSGDAWLEEVGRFLRGLADLLILIAERLVEFGETLIARAQAQVQGAVR